MTNTAWLPKLLRWLFTFFVVVMTLGAIAVCVVIVIDPTLPPGTHFGPMKVDFLGQPGSVVLQRFGFRIDGVSRGFRRKHSECGRADRDAQALWFAADFVADRVLHRRVRASAEAVSQCRPPREFHTADIAARADSRRLASRLLDRVGDRRRLVCPCDVCLSGSERADRGFGIAVTPAAVSHNVQITMGDDFPFGTPIFFSGLLVLALSEVFRQGLALKSENDLTV